MPSMNAVTTIRCALRLLVSMGSILARASRDRGVTNEVFIRVLSDQIEIARHHRRTPLNGAGHHDDRGHRKGRQPPTHRLHGRLPRTGALLADLLYAALNSADEHRVRIDPGGVMPGSA